MSNNLTLLALTAIIAWLRMSYVTAAVSCKDNENRNVDWFTVYKLPRHHRSATFLYMDSKTENFARMSTSLNGSSAISYTLGVAYSNRKSTELGFIFYNDEKPDGSVTGSRGHTKGVTVFDKDSGLWLVHSVPKFPPATDKNYSYPSSADIYGQHFLCVSLRSSADVTLIGEQLLHNEPFIYDQNLPKSMQSEYPIMDEVIQSLKPKSIYNIAQLTSAAGIRFLSFAKSRRFGDDLYSGLVAPKLQCNLLVETWRLGRHSDNMPSNCSSYYQVENVEEIRSTELDVQFKTTSDHSKFAVCARNANTTQEWTVTCDNSWVCVGDINRQFSQRFRGGGTVCLCDTSVSRQYMDLIYRTETCPPSE